MHKPIGRGDQELNFLSQLARSTGRRTFLKWSGITLAVTAIGCGDDNNNGVSLGTGDFAVLNYAYALEQLEAAFYTMVVAQFAGSNLTADEQTVLTDIRNHEVIHREFFKAALGSNAIGSLEVDFTSVTFTDRQSVLNTARTFEDLGVSAYNGAGQLLQSGDYLLAAGKIVSVEARHAAAIRDLLNPKSADFAGGDVVDGSGLDVSRNPSDVLSMADTYIVTEIDASNLP